ncbi:MAG: electron transfer flavoprotein subunit beta [Coxiella sp. DG_40]|nr:MAG: electron transfer flavoprotein subunit beta [Coxiella sp. DG_40]
MSLKIVVLVKQVPDTKNITSDAMTPEGTVNRAALSAIVNPEDLNALEEALKIKESVGAVITAITLGPPSAVKVLKECLYRGADDVVLVTDQKFAASDTLATSYALKCAIERIGDCDLIFCGRQAIDGDTAQVGPQIAEKLGIDQLTCVSEVVATDSRSITVRRAIEGGYEVVRNKFPVLVTITADANEPRSPSVRQVMIYKNIATRCVPSDDVYMYPDSKLCNYIKEWHLDDIKADPKLCGLTGSATRVKSIENVVLAARDIRQVSNDEIDISNLVSELVTEHILG